jgi:hypothetical protein
MKQEALSLFSGRLNYLRQDKAVLGKNIIITVWGCFAFL